MAQPGMGVSWVGADGSSTAQRYADWARHAAASSPSYERLSAGVAADDEVLALLDTLPTPKRQPNLLMGAVRYLDGPIGDYPSFRTFVTSHWDELAAIISVRRTQTNEPRRLATLLPVLATLSQPLALLEIGASAGLCLYPDRYAYRYDDRPVLGDSPVVLPCTTRGPVPLPRTLPEVAWRGGLDLNPLDVRDEDDVRWLEALIWPEEHDRIAILHDALAIARDDPADIVTGDLTRDLVDVARRAPDAATLVVFHSAVLAYVDDKGRAALRDQLAQIAATRPVVWIANEAGGIVVPVGGDVGPGPNEFVLTVDADPVALAEGHGYHLTWLRSP